MSSRASTSVEEHRAAASRGGPIPFGLVTASDTKTEETDANGRFLRDAVAAAGHTVVYQAIVTDDPQAVSAALDAGIETAARILVFNGGTGIASRDNTYDVLAARMQKTLPGFGELFRMLSWQQVGAAAMLSRAVAGTVASRRPESPPAVVIALPGSPAAVRLAWESLIGPEAEHLAWEVGR